ncbi:MAG: alpha/beta hydrolase [Actinomycetota bacterium]
MLREVAGPPGPPYARSYRGRFDVLTIESEILRDNPLRDPATRPLYVYLPRGVDESSAQKYPSIYLIQGMTGQLDMWLNRAPFEPTVVERIDGLFSQGDVPPAIVVFVDAWTSYGGSQFINSTGTGRYMDYLCDEVTAFVDSRYPTIPDRESRALTGKSSGGYGAMVVPMLRPDVFGALATHAGDALFEVCYMHDFRATARTLRDKFDGSYENFFKSFRTADHIDWDVMDAPLNAYAMAACYSPNNQDPTTIDLPFEIDSGRLIDDVWQRWLAWDPVRMVPDHLDALRSMRLIYIDAGRADDYYLDLGAQAFSKELTKAGIEHTLELFEGTHAGIQFRYPKAVGALAYALES